MCIYICVFIYDWAFFANDCAIWRQKVRDEKVAFESSLIANEKLKRNTRKGQDVELTDHIGDRYDLTYDISGRFCLSKEGK